MPTYSISLPDAYSDDAMELTVTNLGASKLTINGEQLKPKAFKRTYEIESRSGDTMTVRLKKGVMDVLPKVIIDDEERPYHDPYPSWAGVLMLLWFLSIVGHVVSIGFLSIFSYIPFYLLSYYLLLTMENKNTAGVISIGLLLMSGLAALILAVIAGAVLGTING